MAATRECSRPAQPAPSEASRPRFDVDGSGDIDGEELGRVAKFDFKADARSLRDTSFASVATTATVALKTRLA